MGNFARGARVKPKEFPRPNSPINEEISFPQFIAMMGIYTVRDYKIRDKAIFLKYCAAAFDGAMNADPTSGQEKP